MKQTAKIKFKKGCGGFKKYYIDFEGNRYWYSQGYSRTTLWECLENNKTLKVIIYPFYSCMSGYIDKDKEVSVKIINNKETI